MADLVAQVQRAAHQGDWPDVVQGIQQLCLTDRHLTLTEADRALLLGLALEALAEGDFQEQWEIAKLLPKFGPAAIAPLITLVRDDTAELEARWFAIRVLGATQDPQAIATLIELLQQDGDDDLTAAAAEALADLGTAAVTVFVPLLADPALKAYAVKALAQIRHSATIAPLLPLAQDPDPTLRTLVIEALSSFHDPQIPPVLLQALHDPASAVRQAAIAGLAVRSDLAAELDLVSPLAACLGDEDLAVGRRAAVALGRLGDERAIAPLQALLHHPQTPLPLQQETIRALSWLPSEAALRALQQALVAPATPVDLQVALITALGRWENPASKASAAHGLAAAIAIPTIQADPATRRAIASALGQLQQPDSIPLLLDLLGDADPTVSLHAIAALKQFAPEIVRPPFQAWLALHPLSAVAQASLAPLLAAGSGESS